MYLKNYFLVRKNLASNAPTGGNGGRSLSPNNISIPSVARESKPNVRICEPARLHQKQLYYQTLFVEE